MKTRSTNSIVIVLSVLLFLVIGIIPAYAQYTEQVSDPRLAFHHQRQASMDKIKLVPESIDISIEQEESTIFYANITLSKGYEFNSVFPYIQNLPDGVIAQVAPSNLSIGMQGNSATITITLYANHDAKPGKYQLDVMALGYIQNINTQKLVPTKDKVLGKINLAIQENKKSLLVDVGEPVFNYQNFCDNSTKNQICQGTGFAEYPVMIFSDKPTRVILGVSEHSPDTWAKLVPDQLEALPNGTKAKLITAGYQSIYSTPMPDKDVWSVSAQSENDRAVDFFEYIRSPQIAILQSAQPISTYDSAYAKTTGTGITTFGVVYEPGDKAHKPISVSLSYAGLAKGNDIEKPDWLQVEFPSSPFVLNPSEPYFFPVKVTTNHAKSGPHWMNINQIIDGKQFVQRLNLSVYDAHETFEWDTFTGKGWWDRLVQSHELGSPVSQMKFGIELEEIQCKQRLERIIKSSDGSPICVKAGHKSKFLENGFAFDSYETYHKQPKIITDTKNNTGIISWKNQNYYFETPHYTDDVYNGKTQISFHDVVFTLFPQPFNGGLPVSGCGGKYYWADAKFSDGTNELLRIFVNSKPCSDNSIPIVLSSHTNPQAGIAFIGDSLRLFVSLDSNAQSDTKIPKDITKS